MSYDDREIDRILAEASTKVKPPAPSAAGSAAAAAPIATTAAITGGATGRFPLTVGEATEIAAMIGNALREDLGGFGSLGDVTTLSTIGPNITGTARFLAKADGVLAGLCVAQTVFEAVDKSLKVDWSKNDGDAVTSGTHFGTVSGSARSILIAERLALNLLQRMSGVATATRRLVDAVKHTNTRILDTRKTLPGLRVVEKLAVRIGGGTNHRFGLFDMVLIKDNHVSASGGVSAAVTNVHQFLASKNAAAGSTIAIEIETRNLDEVKQALALGGIDRILLDNMVTVNPLNGNVDVSVLADAMKLVAAHNAAARKANPKQTGTAAAAVAAAAAKDSKSPAKYPLRVIETEASGNVSQKTVAPMAGTGVDFISSGSLTHSVIALDISLKIVTAKL